MLTLNDDEYSDFGARLPVLFHVEDTCKLQDEHERVVKLLIVLHPQRPHINGGLGPDVVLFKVFKTRGKEERQVKWEREAKRKTGNAVKRKREHGSEVGGGMVMVGGREVKENRMGGCRE